MSEWRLFGLASYGTRASVYLRVLLKADVYRKKHDAILSTGSFIALINIGRLIIWSSSASINLHRPIGSKAQRTHISDHNIVRDTYKKIGF